MAATLTDDERALLHQALRGVATAIDSSEPTSAPRKSAPPDARPDAASRVVHEPRCCRGVSPSAIPREQTIWAYGVPTRVDSVAVLQAVADGADSPDPESVLLPVEAVVAKAAEEFGHHDAHEVENHSIRSSWS